MSTLQWYRCKSTEQSKIKANANSCIKIRVFAWLTSKAVFNWPAWYKSKNCIRSSNKKNVFILLWLAVLPRDLYLKKKCEPHDTKFIILIISMTYTHWFSVDNKTKIPRFRAWIHKSQKNGQKAIQISRHCHFHVHFALIWDNDIFLRTFQWLSFQIVSSDNWHLWLPLFLRSDLSVLLNVLQKLRGNSMVTCSKKD